MANKMHDRKEVANQIVNILPMMMRRTGSGIRSQFPNIGPAHFGIMMSLQRGARTVTALSNDQEVSTATMSKSVDTLVERGWIHRKTLQHDRRKVELSLTSEGANQIACLQFYLEDRVVAALGAISDGDLDKLSMGLGLLHKVLKQMDQIDQQESIKTT
ncbi:MAG: MarR family transcriptional regulator [Anaerolineae bacterium]|jgi:DNA-binding MarR family transcriptional regulator|nr:MarR family transcriptional regulator [Anaerolineae bacterium]